MRRHLLLCGAVLFALTGSPSLKADDDEEERPPTLTVTGDATVRATPDQATVRLGAVAQAPEAQTAQDEVSKIVRRTITSLKEAGIPAERIGTVEISISPVYDDRRRPPRPEENDEGPKIVGYRASNTVQVIVRDLSMVGKVIDVGVSNGANQIQQLSFGLSDDTEQRIEALRRSVREARNKARAISEALGYRIVGVRSVNEGGVHLVEPRFQMARLAMDAAGTPVEPGQVEVNASVSIEYRIESSDDEEDSDEEAEERDEDRDEDEDEEHDDDDSRRSAERDRRQPSDPDSVDPGRR